MPSLREGLRRQPGLVKGASKDGPGDSISSDRRRTPADQKGRNVAPGPVQENPDGTGPPSCRLRKTGRLHRGYLGLPDASWRHSSIAALKAGFLSSAAITASASRRPPSRSVGK